MRELGITRYTVGNKGDDSLIFTDADSGDYRQAFSDLAKSYGFKFTGGWAVPPKSDPKGPMPARCFIEHVDFCRSRPVWVGGAEPQPSINGENKKWSPPTERLGHYTMVRWPHRATGTILATSNFIASPGEWRRYCRSVALCETITSAGVPISSSLAAKMLEQTEGIKALRHSFRYDFAWKAREQGYNLNQPKLARLLKLRGYQVPPTALSRMSYYHAFGLTPTEQRAAENRNSELDLTPITSTIFRRITEQDATIIDYKTASWNYPETRLQTHAPPADPNLLDPD